MLTTAIIREKRDYIIERLRIKGFDATALTGIILNSDVERRNLMTLSESLQAEINRTSKQIGAMMKEGNKAEAAELKEATRIKKEEIKRLEASLSEATAVMNEALLKLPNIPDETVPPGKGPDENLLVREWGEIPSLPDNARPHWELIKDYGIIDFDLGVKITGAGFPLYRGKGASLQRALISFFIAEGIKAGYEEVIPPVLVNEASAFGTGQLPDKDGMMYGTKTDNLYLIPTAEVPLTNIYRDTILNEGDLPVKLVSYTPCFRREAGSWGSDVRGLNRLHQFDKVEIVQITSPGLSYQALEEMAGHTGRLIEKLGLPYRVMLLCGGDMSFTSAKTYDFEVYSAAQQKWLEVSSVSNFESFQSNRLKCRYRKEGSRETSLAHTLNGSALALPRIVAALLENNQRDGEIIIPEPLVPYTGFTTLKPGKE